MKLIVGLGNPGEKYAKTRHNLGFMIVEQFLKDFEPVSLTQWDNNKELKADIALLTWQPKQGTAERVVLAKPQTYMNNSGMAVQLLMAYYKVISEDLWVVYDELDLPMGAVKIRYGGAAAGHHGVESILEQLATDKFWRFRMGIGTSSHHATVREDGKRHTISRKGLGDVTEYVVGDFSASEKGKVKELIKHGSQSLQVALEKGMETAMNRFNMK